MNSKSALLVLVYGGVLIGLGALAHSNNPEVAKLTMITASFSGGLCLIWGIWGLLGFCRLMWVGWTIGLTGAVLVTQTVTAWMSADEIKSGSRLAAILMTVMLFASVGVLAYVLHFGKRLEADRLR